MPTDPKNTTAKPSTKSQEAGSAGSGSDRRIVVERRAAKERRRENKPVAVERRKVERRINEYPMSPEVLEFINALNHFKSVNQKPFPTWSEIFEIFTGLGYRKPDAES